ncbi:hypothetical protein STEG23_014304, partial [Scotinomys teguina]
EATEKWNVLQDVPYAFKNTDWVGYDNAKSFQIKDLIHIMHMCYAYMCETIHNCRFTSDHPVKEKWLSPNIIICQQIEFCEFPKTLTAPKKDALFKTMINLGIISALKVSVRIEDYELKLVAVEIFTYLVEYNTWIVQVYAIEEALDSENDDDFLINIMIKQITCDSDPESSQLLSLAAVLHTLLDTENMGVTANGCERMEFMNFFYAHCIDNLAGPVLSIIGQNESDDNRANICTDNYQNV